MLEPSLPKNDKQASWLIAIFSVVVFTAVIILGKVKLDIGVSFDVHIFAKINAFINATIAVLLVAALVTVKQKKYALHKKIMLIALLLSVAFLVSYILHHLLAGEAKFGDTDHDGIVSEAEKLAVGGMRMVYFVILITHIFLAAIILPFILFTAYRGLTAEYPKHKKIAKITWPLWFYVAVTGPVVYWMISPYYT
jgi:putative membrane protein